MVINWTPVMAGLAGLSGAPEYRVESDGLVRWRGEVTLTVGGGLGFFPLPVAAMPIASVVPLFIDWATGDRQLDIEAAAVNLVIGRLGDHIAGKIVDLTGFCYQGTPPPSDPHTLSGVEAGIKAALETIDGLRVYGFASDRIEAPAAILQIPGTSFDVTFGGRSYEWTFPLWVFVSRADDKASHIEISGYLEADGPKSIRAVIEADHTLGGAADTCVVRGASPVFATVAGTDYLAIEFTLEVYT